MKKEGLGFGEEIRYIKSAREFAEKAYESLKHPIKVTDKVNKWVNASNVLRENPYARVKCPECNIGYMYVKDELIPYWENKLDRYMICNHCGQYNVLTMEIPKDYKSPNENPAKN